MDINILSDLSELLRVKKNMSNVSKSDSDWI